jgi:hypothetical protein
MARFCCPLVPTPQTNSSQLCVWVHVESSGPPSAQSPFAWDGCYPPTRVTQRSPQRALPPPSQLLQAHASDHGPPHASVVPWWWGLCRLSRVPAGPWPFPTLSLPSVCGCSDPYPAVFVRCACPFLLRRQRPHVTGNTFGTRENPCEATSTGSGISGLQSFADLRAPTLARPPGRSHRSQVTGRPGRLHHAWPEGLPTSGCGIATCLHGHLTRLDFHQLDGSLVGCSFPHCAFLFTSHQGLWGLSCWECFRPWPLDPILIKQAQLGIQPLPTPPLPAEAPEFPGTHQVPPHLLFHPVFNEVYFD